MYKIGILGVGKMGGAILDGIISSNIAKKNEILLYTTNESIKKEYINNNFIIAKNELDLFLNSKIILLAIKPQIFDNVLPLALDYDFSNKLIISIAAGKKIDDIKKYFKNSTVIRAMPNLPASIKKGAITFAKSNDDDLVSEGVLILSSIGLVKEIKEEEMDDTVPINGSMPAYAYLFAKAFIDYAVSKGIDKNTALELTCESIKGSMDMLMYNKNYDIDTLINNVCSKGGTTIEGLNILNENKFSDIIKDCCEACSKRSKELA